MVPVFCCGCECGVDGPHFSLAGAAASFNTGTKRTGLRSIRTNPTAATTGEAQAPIGSSSGFGVSRSYISVATVPTANRVILGYAANSAGSRIGLGYKTADGLWYAAIDDGAGGVTFGATGVAITLNTQTRIDIKIDTSANPWLVNAQVDGVALGQASIARALDTAAGGFRLGTSLVSATFDIFHDDIVLSQTLADYPIGAGHVESLVPNADGTHTATTTLIVKGTAAAPTGGGAITSATTDAFNWVNARPIGGGATDATRLINQQSNGSTIYVEVDFEPATATVAPRAVEVLTADQQAATGTGDFTTKLNDNGTENTIIARGVVAGVVTDRYARKHYATMPADSAAWTLARFNALKARFGYASDANPDQYWRGIMIEAEFVDVSAFLASPPVIVRQAVQRASVR